MTESLLEIFILISVLLALASAETYDPTTLTSGFSFCYIELAFFSETAEFIRPPNTPVAITQSKFSEMSSKNYEQSDRAAIRSGLCNERRIEFLQKFNCLALFLLSPHENPGRSIEGVLNRYSWIFKCPRSKLPASHINHKNYKKQTYLVIVQDEDSKYSYKNVLLDWSKMLHLPEGPRLPIFYYTIKEMGIELSAELLAPCEFKVTHDSPSHRNIKEAFDALFNFGQRTKCSALTWIVIFAQSDGDGSDDICTSIRHPPSPLEQEAFEIMSMVTEGFPNSTTPSRVNTSVEGEADAFKKCMKLINEVTSLGKLLLLSQGYPFKLSVAHPMYYIFYEEAYNFVTCDGAKEYMSFEAFVSPFQFSAWIGIILTSVSAVVFIHAFLYFKKMQAKVSLLVPSVLLEQSPHPPSKLLSFNSFRCLLICLLFFGILITNCYKSMVTADLTASLPIYQLATLDDAVRLGYKILPPLQLNMILIAKNRKYKTFEKRKNKILKISLLTTSLREQLGLPQNRNSPQKLKKLQDLLSQFEIPKDFPKTTFQMEIGRCDKSIYVDHSYPLDEFLTELLTTKGLRSKPYKGKDSFQQELHTWAIGSMEWDRTEMISTRFSAISHSGIFKHLENVYRIDKMRLQLRKLARESEVRVKDPVRPLALKTNILSVFVAYLGCMFFCLTVFGAEKLNPEISRMFKIIFKRRKMKLKYGTYWMD
jgi:hypothetical protein